MPKIDTLTSLRFFASAAIVIFHMQLKILGVPATVPLALGVSFFFVLSGFILTYTYGSRRFDYRKFLVSRFARLWPVHAVTAALTLRFLDTLDYWPATAVNFTMLHAWIPVPAFANSLNWVSWSISDEVFFYLVFPLFAFAARVKTAALCLAAATIAGLILIGHVIAPQDAFPTGPASNYALSPFDLILNNPAFRLLEFVAGVVAGRLYLSGRLRSLVQRHATTLECAAVAIVGLYCFSTTVTPWVGRPGLFALAMWYGQAGGFLPFAAAILIFGHARGQLSRLLAVRPLVLLGEISFCTYMVHQLLIRYASDNHLLDPKDPSIAGVIALTIAIYGASWLLWAVVEKPLRRWIVSAYEFTRDAPPARDRQIVNRTSTATGADPAR